MDEKLSPGDHVTRGGDDVHRVESVTADGFSADFVCVVAPASGWCEVGELEHNLCARYTRVAHPNPIAGRPASTGERNDH